MKTGIYAAPAVKGLKGQHMLTFHLYLYILLILSKNTKNYEKNFKSTKK